MANSRSAIEAGVCTDPTICIVSAAESWSAARRAMKASSTVSLNRTSLSTRLRNTSAGTTMTSPGLGDPGRQVRPLAGDETDLAEEAAWAVPHDRLAVGADDVGRGGDENDPVIRRVGGREQDLADLDGSALSEAVDDGELTVVESGEADAVRRGIGHGVLQGARSS